MWPMYKAENRRHYRSIDEARRDVFDYIERFHNPRMQQKLDAEDQKFLALTQLSVKRGRTPTESMSQRPQQAFRRQGVQDIVG